MTTLVIATRNSHKVGEIRTILGDGFQYLSLMNFPGAPAVQEDADTFAGNAAKKATELAAWLATNPSTSSPEPPTPIWVLADDSGLEVDVLGGAPGVHSARFAALERNPAECGTTAAATTNSSDADNNARLLRLLEDVPAEKRTARFHCVIALVEMTPNSELRTPNFFDGACEGRIDFAPHGAGGFGYDPLFVPEGFTESFAELGENVKNRLSHRARALAKLKAALLQ